MKYLLLILAAVLLHAVAHTQGCTVNYVEPNFQIQKTDEGCVPGTGRIEVINQTGGVAPITYKLVETNTINSTGLFTNLAAGLYTVELRDACGTVRTRQVTLVPFSFSFQYNVSKTSDCSDGEVTFTATPANVAFEYGVVRNGDTIWSSTPVINLKLYKTLTLLVKDPCGNVKKQTWNAPANFLPYIAALQYRLQCDKFDLFPLYYGFEDAEVCLYEHGTNTLIGCKNASGNYTGGALTNFFDIPWGAYYVIVQDNCFRDSMYHPDMRSAGGSELNPYNWDCNMFTMHVDGMEDTVCLYNAITNQLISCKGQDTISINPRTGVPWPSGAVWDSLPYGSYYAWIYDPCEDSTFKIDTTVVAPFNNFITSLPGCNLSQTTVQVNFDPGSKKPYTVKVYNNNGSLNSTFTTNVNDNYFGVNVDSSGGLLTVIGYDACGNADTAVVAPQMTVLEKNVSVFDKCPGVTGTGGSGDVRVMATTRSSVAPVPQIIEKNGSAHLVSFNYQANDTFYFPNLETGTYVIKYTFTNCSQMVLYDTVQIKDYVYPTQTADTAIQCGGNMFTFTFPIVGGLNPYTFQVIGNVPALPSLVSLVQASPSFTIGNGQHYTSVTVRAIDRCGNSTIGDIAVQPINGCSTLPADSGRNSLMLSNILAKVYPNPSKGEFIVSISQKKKTNYRIDLVNASGIRVYEKLLFNVDRKVVLVNEQLIPGLYILNVTDLLSGKTSVFKQIVQ